MAADNEMNQGTVLTAVVINNVGPLSTKFPVDQMAFGQSWPKT